MQLTQREFTPPFEFGDVSKSEMQPLIKVDQSFVDPETGILVHDLRFRHNDDGWFNWGGDPFGWSEQHCRIGVNFRVPETGFVDFNVVIQNLYNKISYSVSDNFGFSDATLQIFHSLIVRVVRVGSGQRFGTETEMVTAGIVSFGEEYSFSTSQIQNSTPFTLSFRNEDAYLKGEQLRVEVVSRIYIRSSVNDMQTHVDAVIAWQLKKILVSMV